MFLFLGVGGTVGGTAGSEPTGETADSISGGGFTDYWTTPDWQKDAVSNYQTNCAANKCPPSSTWNAGGRGYPDIAAQSEGFLVLTFGFPMPVSGTSAACPTASGIIGLINDARIAAGKKSLGFLPPFLYHAASVDPLAFNDVVSGTNQGCSNGGFTAAKAWDPGRLYLVCVCLLHFFFLQILLSLFDLLPISHWSGNFELQETCKDRSLSPLNNVLSFI